MCKSISLHNPEFHDNKITSALTTLNHLKPIRLICPKNYVTVALQIEIKSIVESITSFVYRLYCSRLTVVQDSPFHVDSEQTD